MLNCQNCTLIKDRANKLQQAIRKIVWNLIRLLLLVWQQKSWDKSEKQTDCWRIQLEKILKPLVFFKCWIMPICYHISSSKSLRTEDLFISIDNAIA